MAVVEIPLNSTLVVVYQTGLTPAGGPVLRQKSLSDVRSDAAEQAVYDAAHALFGLAALASSVFPDLGGPSKMTLC
jgi:hypothetical protein